MDVSKVMTRIERLVSRDLAWWRWEREDVVQEALLLCVERGIFDGCRVDLRYLVKDAQARLLESDFEVICLRRFWGHLPPEKTMFEAFEAVLLENPPSSRVDFFFKMRKVGYYGRISSLRTRFAHFHFEGGVLMMISKKREALLREMFDAATPFELVAAACKTVAPDVFRVCGATEAVEAFVEEFEPPLLDELGFKEIEACKEIFLTLVASGKISFKESKVKVGWPDIFKNKPYPIGSLISEEELE